MSNAPIQKNDIFLPYMRDVVRSEQSLRELNLMWRMIESSAKNGSIKLVAGNSNPVLAQAIANWLNMPLTKASVRRFADNEIFVEVLENGQSRDEIGALARAIRIFQQAMDHIAHQDGLDGQAFHLAHPKGQRSGDILNTFARAGESPAHSKHGLNLASQGGGCSRSEVGN